MPKREIFPSILLAPRPPSRSPQTYDPHSIRCTAGCHTPRDFVPWRFSAAGRRSAWIASSCRRPKTYTTADVTGDARAATKAIRLPREVRMAAYRGSCICGEVVFEVDGPFDRFLNCHCSRCRKATGTAHSCEVIVKASAVRWLRGARSVARFDLPQARRFATAFCIH